MESGLRSATGAAGLGTGVSVPAVSRMPWLGVRQAAVASYANG
jgi:hypothetical protein